MPYIGNTPALDYISYAVQNFTVTAGTTVYTLDYSVANENDIRLVINNVIQRPGASYAYSATGTTLTLTSATLSTDTMYAVFIGRAVQTVVPAAGSILNSMVASNAAIESSKLSITSPLSITGNSTAGSEIRLPEDTDNGSNYVALKAANSIASNLTFTLPSADGSANQALITNGSGSLSFATVGATAGQVIQVLGATDTTSRSTTSSSFVTASNTLSVTITPSASANKILILVSTTSVCTNDTGFMTIYRGATNLGSSNGLVGSQADKGENPTAMIYLDSPNTTSATTYQVYIRSTGSGAGAIYVNGSFTSPATTSSIVCMEIKG